MSALIARVVALGREIAADYRPDTYQIIRASSTHGDSTGTDDESETVAETGGCVLTAGATRPEEREAAARLQATAPYIVRNMPHDTILASSDVLAIGGRRFEVLGVLRAEAVNVAVTAICEER